MGAGCFSREEDGLIAVDGTSLGPAAAPAWVSALEAIPQRRGSPVKKKSSRALAMQYAQQNPRDECCCGCNDGTEGFTKIDTPRNGFKSARPISDWKSARNSARRDPAQHLCESSCCDFPQPLWDGRQTMEEVYEIEREDILGQGGLGVVRRATHKRTKAVRAVKIISPHALEVVGVKALQHEVGIMRLLDHPHIIKLYEVFHDTCVYLIMELCTGGELFDRIVREAERGFTESRAAELMKQILSAIGYMHLRSIVHRDLKPENFLLQDPSPEALIKIIDFGSSAQIEPGGELTLRVGTPSYVAPEVLRGRYSCKADIWSCGVVCYILLSGSPPFHGRESDIMLQIMSARYEFPKDPWNDVSEEAKDFIGNMLNFQEDRAEAADLLNHPWIQHRTQQDVKPLGQGVLTKLKVFNCSRRRRDDAPTHK